MPTQRRSRALRLPGGGPQAQAVSDSASLIDFLAAVQQHHVSLLPVSYQAGREILGRGLSGSIYQATADYWTAFAFKEGVPLRHGRDDDKDQSWYSLVTEIAVLQHPPIQDSHHIIDLLGVSFSVDAAPDGDAAARPLLVTLRANMGDMETVLTGVQWPLTPELRRQVFVEVAEAVYLLHSCGVAHGDIKPNNIVVEQQGGEINCRLIDFGSCVIKGQDRFPTWNPPWNPPELGSDAVFHAVGFEQLSQADLFSLGLLLVHILLPLRCLREAGICCLREDQSDQQWEETMFRLERAKSFDAESPGAGFDLLGPRLVLAISQSDIDDQWKALLESIVRSTVCSPSGSRMIPWDEVLRLGRDHLSSDFKPGPYNTVEPPRIASSSAFLGHAKHTPFDPGRFLGELDDTDYIVRRTIFHDLQRKAESSACPECRQHYGFHLAISYGLGFGGNKDDAEKAKWLQKAGKSQSDTDLASDIIGKTYNGTNRVSQFILERLGIGVLQTSDRATAYQASGRLLEAEACLKKEIDARGLVFGPKHPCLARLQSELVQVLRSEGRLEDAGDYQQTLADVQCQEHGADHPTAIMARLTMADIWTDQGHVRKAEVIMQEDVPRLVKALGREHPDVLVAMHLQANMKTAAGDLLGAEAILREVMALRNKILGPEHPLTVNSELSLVNLLGGRGQFNPASDLLGKIEDKLKSVLEGDRLRQVNFYTAQAMLYNGMWMLDKAKEKAGLACVALDRMRLDAEDSLVVQVKGVQAQIHHAAGEWAEEEELLRQIFATANSGGHTNQMMNTKTLVQLARNLWWQGRHKDAYATAEEAIQCVGPSPLLANPFDYVASVTIAARSLGEQGRQDAAGERLQDLYESCVREFGGGHAASVEAADELGEFWSDQGQYERSQQVFEPILESLRTLGGMPAVRVARKLAIAYRERGLFNQAVELCHEAAQWATEAGGDSHPATLGLHNVLGSVYIQLARLDEADELLSRIDSQCHEAMLGSYIKNNLRMLRKAQGRMEEALELSLKARSLMSRAPQGVNSESLILEGNALSDCLGVYGLSETLETAILANLRQREQVQGPRHPGRIAMMADLAYAYGTAGRLEDAERLFGEIDQLGGMSDREQPMRCATMLAKRADVCFRLGQRDEAERLERRALAIRARMYAADHDVVLTTKANLASTLNALGKHADAEALLREVLASRQKRAAGQGAAVARVVATQRDLASVLCFQGKLEEALSLYKDALEASMAAGQPRMVDHMKESIEIVQQKMRKRSGEEEGDAGDAVEQAKL